MHHDSTFICAVYTTRNHNNMFMEKCHSYGFTVAMSAAMRGLGEVVTQHASFKILI